MSKPSQKKAKRRNAKKSKLKAHDKSQADRKALIRSFPEIVIEDSNAPAPLAKAIKTAARSVAIDQEAFLGNSAYYFREAKLNGFPAVFEAISNYRPLSERERLGKAKTARAFPTWLV